jgi:amidohydrolase
VPVGEARIGPGPCFAAGTHFRIIVRGRGGHASAPQETVDPIVVAAHAVVALQTVVSRSVASRDEAVLTIGRLQGGNRGNIIPDEVMMSGSIRTFDPLVLEGVLARMEEILAGVAAAFGAEYQFDHSTLPAVVNDASCAALVARAAAGFLGAERVRPERQMGSDDMAYFLEARPGAYFFLGGGNAAKGMTHPHHTSRFDFDEDCLGLGIEIALRVIEEATGAELVAGRSA